MHIKEFLRIPRNSQKTGNSVCKGHLHNWEFLRIPRNSQKTGNSVRKGIIGGSYMLVTDGGLRVNLLFSATSNECFGHLIIRLIRVNSTHYSIFLIQQEDY